MTSNQRPTAAPFQSTKQIAPTASESLAIDKTKMYGVLHEMDGRAVQRHVRTLKVGFGLPAGKDIHVYLQNDKDKPWVIEVGKVENGKRIGADLHTFSTKRECWSSYLALRKTSPERKYPTKFPYFTFSRLGIDGVYHPDLDSMEKHGVKPNEIEVTFITDEPLENAFQAWTAAELKCEGNGRFARRRCNWAQTDSEKKLAAHAKAQGQDWFPITGCFTGGCLFPKGDKPACKPHGRLFFQLTYAPRIGGSCTYDTTGYRSISQLFSCIEQIKAMTGNGEPAHGFIAGIPLVLVLRPYKVSHNGQPSIQYAVSLEFRANNATEMARMLNRHAREFVEATKSEPLQIAAPMQEEDAPVDDIQDGEVEEVPQSTKPAPYPNEAAEASAMAGEFYTSEEENPDWQDEALSADLDEQPGDVTEPMSFRTEVKDLPVDAVGPFKSDQIPASQMNGLMDLFTKNGHGRTLAQLIGSLSKWDRTLGEFIAALGRAKQ